MKLKNGDYIDTLNLPYFSVCKFFDTAVDQGFFHKGSIESYDLSYPLVLNEGVICEGFPEQGKYRNVTLIFKGQTGKPFTKSDLKDGMQVETRKEGEYYVCGDALLRPGGHNNFINYNNDLTCNARNSCVAGKYDIIRVTDRDGTVVFEREEKNSNSRYKADSEGPISKSDAEFYMSKIQAYIDNN